MPIAISCPKCNRKYAVRDELAGKVAKCPCGQSITISKPSPAAAPIAAKPVADPLSQFADDLPAQPSSLPPLAARGKGKNRTGRKKGNRYLIPAIASGAVVAVLLVAILA